VTSLGVPSFPQSGCCARRAFVITIGNRAALYVPCAEPPTCSHAGSCTLAAAAAAAAAGATSRLFDPAAGAAAELFPQPVPQLSAQDRQRRVGWIGWVALLTEAALLEFRDASACACQAFARLAEGGRRSLQDRAAQVEAARSGVASGY
jgi:hypothetical protein